MEIDGVEPTTPCLQSKICTLTKISLSIIYNILIFHLHKFCIFREKKPQKNVNIGDSDLRIMEVMRQHLEYLSGEVLILQGHNLSFQ